MHWLTLTVASMVFFTILALVQRKIAVESRFPMSTAILFNLSAIFFAFLLFVMTGSYKNLSFPRDPSAWIYLTLAVAMYGLFERGRFFAAKQLDASTLSIISNVSLAVAFTGSIFLYSESFTGIKIAGALMIFIALVIISYQKKFQVGSISAILLGVLIYTLLGLGWMLDKKGANYFGANVYNLFVWALPIVFILMPKVNLAELKYEFKKSNWSFVIPSFLNAAGYFLQLKAMETGNATQIIPIVQTSTLLTVVAGIVIMGERNGIVKKIFAAILALIGSYLLIGVV